MRETLMVEDSPINMVLTSCVLKYASHGVFSAEYAAIEIQLAQDALSDFILMNIQHTSIDGLDVIKLRKTERSMPHTLIHASMATRYASDGYLLKPINDQKLLTKMEAV